jgi:hypothetical protein
MRIPVPMIVLVRPYRKKFRVFSGKAYLDYYHTVRPHLALDRNASMPRLNPRPK